MGTNGYKLHQKFSGCGACSAVVGHFEPTDSYYDTSVENRFKTLKHNGGRATTWSMLAGCVRGNSAQNDFLPHSTRRKHSRTSDLQPGKGFSRSGLTVWVRRSEGQHEENGYSPYRMTAVTQYPSLDKLCITFYIFHFYRTSTAIFLLMLCDMCVSVLCLIVVPLSPGKFAVQLNTNSFTNCKVKKKVKLSP
jgi:hypothetical protein